jgi:hypothetical protein
VAELDAREFDARYRELLGRLHGLEENEACIECIACRGCSQSTFCRDSERLVRCHYCVGCSLCSDCGHCRESTGLLDCNHCIDCESCVSSAYLVRCVGLSECNYCFGCVGISRRDFHILNVRYERAEYFGLTKRLLVELGL